MTRRVAQLLASCVVLGVGVALLLRAALGSDGFSTMVNGVTIATGLPFVVVNTLVSVALVAMAWARGLKPGLGTVVQPVLVGYVIGVILATVAEPEPLWLRGAFLIVAFPVLAIGVAGYLGSGTGAGPAEAGALAWDPPIPFAIGYSLVQGCGALIGWLLGADVGIGTVLVILLIGPAVKILSSRVTFLDVHATQRAASPAGQDRDG